MCAAVAPHLRRSGGRNIVLSSTAAAALYLASPAAPFIIGEVLNINGGWLFGC